MIYKLEVCYYFDHLLLALSLPYINIITKIFSKIKFFVKHPMRDSNPRKTGVRSAVLSPLS